MSVRLQPYLVPLHKHTDDADNLLHLQNAGDIVSTRRQSPDVVVIADVQCPVAAARQGNRRKQRVAVGAAVTTATVGRSSTTRDVTEDCDQVMRAWRHLEVNVRTVSFIYNS